jgi:hypothetical protein
MTLLRASWRMCSLRALLAAVGAALVSVAAAHAAVPTSEQMQLSGVWRVEKPVFQVRTIDGRLPPFRAEAAKIYQERIAARKRGDTSFDGATWCASVGMPRMMFIDAPFEIIVRPSRVIFLYQWNWWTRIVDMASVLAPAPPLPGPTTTPSGQTTEDFGASVPGPMGAALGRWDGNTLVVRTTDLIDTTLIDGAGTPHSDALKLTERVRLLSADRLEDLIRIEDPDTFTAPWETRVTYRRQPGATIKEDVCLDRIKRGEPAVKE